MLKRYIIILILSIIIVIFAVQNVEKVNVQLMMFNFNASLSLLIILTFFAGAILSLALTFQEIRKRNRTISDLKAEMPKQEEPETYSDKATDESFQSET
jgi:uncharacterized integral membrane protein